MASDLSDLVTVCTATLGDSCPHLSRSLTELRQFSSIPFRQIVSDDGTADRSVCDRQREVCRAHGAEWIENPGPVFGISYNLNRLLEACPTPWAFLVEDSVRPSKGWLETALDALDRIGSRPWAGYQVGAIGMATSFENWHLACARVLPTDLGLEHFFDRQTFGCGDEAYLAFWGSERHPHWNDGLWCWERMQPGSLASCLAPAADHWPEIIRRTWRDPVIKGEIGGMKWKDHPYEGWQATGGWPRTRRASWVMGPSAWGLYNIRAWREAGRFRDGCTFYEGHLGTRLARAGYLSINCESPPWHHWSGLAFKVAQHQRTPRHHEPTDGPNGILERDFGVNGTDHVDLAGLARSYFAPGVIDRVNEELSEINLYADPAWAPWGGDQ